MQDTISKNCQSKVIMNSYVPDSAKLYALRHHYVFMLMPWENQLLMRMHVRGLDYYSEVSNVDTVTTNDQLDTHGEAACFEKNFVKFNRCCQAG